MSKSLLESAKMEIGDVKMTENEKRELCIKKMEKELEAIKSEIKLLDKRFKFLNTSIICTCALSATIHTLGTIVQNYFVVLPALASLFLVPIPGIILDKVDKKINELRQKRDSIEKTLKMGYFMRVDKLEDFSKSM